jgi:hypothetical protein
MQVRRSISDPRAGWSSVALHLAAADNGKDGFYLTMFPDARPAATVFLSPRQLQQLLDMAQDQGTSDQSLWDFVAKIPLEPLLPNRSLATRLRWLLSDAAAQIREQVREQLDRRPPPPTPVDEPTNEIEPDSAAPPASKPPWQIP